MATTPRFAPTKAYFELDPDEKSKLKAEAQELRGLLAKPTTPWRTRQNASARLQEVDRLLQSDEFARRQREQVGNRDPGPRLLRSDDGGRFLLLGTRLDDLVR